MAEDVIFYNIMMCMLVYSYWRFGIGLLLQKKSAVQNGAMQTPGRCMDPSGPKGYFKYQFQLRPQSVFMCFGGVRTKYDYFPLQF